MKSKRIAIAIALALILGIIALIGSVRIIKADELSNTLHTSQSRVLLSHRLDAAKLDRLDQRLSLSNLKVNVLQAGLLDRLDHTRALSNNLNLGLVELA